MEKKEKIKMPIRAKPYEHQEKAFEFALKTFGVIASEEDAVDLPPFIDETRLIELEPKAKRTYKSIEMDSYAELSRGEVTAQNVLTKLKATISSLSGRANQLKKMLDKSPMLSDDID